ncbi:hypothetical protein LSHI6S_00696 [Leifsonia shinshuensis]
MTPGEGLQDQEEGAVEASSEDVSSTGEYDEGPVVVVSRRPARPSTGDPELDALWKMSFNDLQKIIDDETHPLNVKAKHVAAEAMKPIRDAVQEITRTVTQGVDFSKTIGAFDLKGLVPVFDTKSWAGRLMPKLATPILPRGLSKTVEPLTHRSPIERIDFDAIAAPLVSVREVEAAAEERAHQLRREQLQVMVELLKETRINAQAGEEALSVSRDGLAAAKSSARAAWIAAWVAVAALAATIAGIVVTVVVSS